MDGEEPLGILIIGQLDPIVYARHGRDLNLGTRPGVANPMSLTRKGPWQSARTMATQTGITNQWLKDQGLVSVKELWVKTCPAVVCNEGGFITRLRLGRLCEPPL